MNTLSPTFFLSLQSTPAKSHITGLDWLMIALYFGILLCVAWWVVRKGKDTAADYFLAGRNLGWWIIGASIFASNIGCVEIESFWVGSGLVIVLTGLYNYLQAVQGYLAPPIFIVFFFGVFFKRLNAKGCLWAMVVGFIMGLFRMMIDTPVALGLKGFENGYAPGSFLWIVNNVYFQYFSVLIALVSAAVMVVVSYGTAKPDYERIKSLTYGTATEEDRTRTRAGWGWHEVVASAFILACILGAYLYFRG
jgi:Na+/proline symporter